MENKEQKATPTTFRITPTTNDKFKELAQSIGLTQEEMLSNLISSYELENAKALIVNREKEIDEFQSHITRLINIYLNSLELNQSSELRIEEKYMIEINKKVEIINLLQEQIKELKEAISKQDVLLTNTLNENAKISDEINTLKDTLKTKENLINEYKEKIDTLTSLVIEYTEYKNNYLSLKTEYENSLSEREKISLSYKEINLEKINLEKRIELLQNSIDEYKLNISNLKSEHKENIKEIKTEQESIIKSIKLELYEASNEYKGIIQGIKNEADTEASRLINEHTSEIENLKLGFKEKIEEIKIKEEDKYTNLLEKERLKFERILLEKDKEINELKIKK